MTPKVKKWFIYFEIENNNSLTTVTVRPVNFATLFISAATKQVSISCEWESLIK